MPLLIIVIFGLLAACFALLLEIGTISIGDITTPTFSSLPLSDFFTLFTASLIEEFSKFLFLIQYGRRFLLPSSSTFTGSLLLGLLFGIGFSLPELALAVTTSPDALLPLLGITLLHIVTSILLAVFVLYRKNKSLLSLSFFIGTAIILHFLYNFIVSSRSV